MGLIMFFLVAVYTTVVIVPAVVLAFTANGKDPDNLGVWLTGLAAAIAGLLAMLCIDAVRSGGRHGSLQEGLDGLLSWVSLAILLVSIVLFAIVKRMPEPHPVRALLFAPAAASVTWLVQCWNSMTS